MTVEKVLTDLEELLSDIGFTGLRNTQPVMLQKMEQLKASLQELGMTEGARQSDDFITSIRAFHTNNLPLTTIVDKLCALDFYVKTIKGNL
ncbi:MAG: hypothetical protein LBV74_20700 [Tannerella sp.]|jgi:hypothetical protein|nr:hypothetical protein [Tannerella sp.]